MESSPGSGQQSAVSYQQSAVSPDKDNDINFAKAES
jgi:hypothetical protein